MDALSKRPYSYHRFLRKVCLVSDPFLVLAKMHKSYQPEDDRTLEQLTAHYYTLSLTSPFTGLVAAYRAADKEEEARFDELSQPSQPQHCRLCKSRTPKAILEIYDMCSSCYTIQLRKELPE